ncbi:MAG: hypothetical protein WCF16_00365, partial [Alphaproteobacteria bacterium]
MTDDQPPTANDGPGKRPGNGHARGGVAQGGNGRPGDGADALARLGAALAFEPLARMSDHDEYRAAYEKYKAKEWDAEQWTAFRLRFGIYGQLQPGVKMIRIKLPGGILGSDGARTIARLNDAYAGGHKQIHVTTRQDIQLYFVPLDDTPDFVEELYAAGI